MFTTIETYRNFVIPEDEPPNKYSTIKFMSDDFYRLNRIYY